MKNSLTQAMGSGMPDIQEDVFKDTDPPIQLSDEVRIKRVVLLVHGFNNDIKDVLRA